MGHFFRNWVVGHGPALELIIVPALFFHWTVVNIVSAIAQTSVSPVTGYREDSFARYLLGVARRMGPRVPHCTPVLIGQVDSAAERFFRGYGEYDLDTLDALAPLAMGCGSLARRMAL